ncbi:hypothetical protein E0H22_02680 [Rhodopseudomonas boonkerdii]|uniref:hypothetical protein n=1 Tax=Rhodopseudomonas boonkerdii TaxID=475937 RepID=UPI001E441CC0|nr:hypothetical protein [Rhodopseudomonas boonkerdii]UGV24685.1 hypothetical protein E0H22_02680 [Rhodopseudomonas boonkerdii]
MATIIKGTIVHHHHHHRLSAEALTVALKAAHDPLRLLSVADYWVEFGEPIDLLEDPRATFSEDAAHLIAACERQGIAYRRGDVPAFPVWLLREFYPANP